MCSSDLVKVGNNLTINVGGYLSLSANNLNASLIPASDNTFSLGNATHQWQSLYVSANTIYVGGTPISIADGVLTVNSEPVTGGGNGTFDAVHATNFGITLGEFAGAPYTFVHNNNGLETDQLSANVAITRGAQGGLYNAVLYETYDDATNGHSGQEGIVDNIEWNSDGWADLSDVADRTYEQNWKTAVNANPPRSVNREFVIHNTDDDTYHTLKFTAWQNAAAGGGFSYIRRLINTSTPYLFTKSNYGNEVDYIDTDVAIDRKSTRLNSSH